MDPAREEFTEVTSYRHYRLKNTSLKYDGRISGRLSRQVRVMQDTFLTEKFSGEDPILVIEFLKEFRDSADHNEVSEGAAARLILYFLAEPARTAVHDFCPSGTRSKNHSSIHGS